jgi:hypothetical protein
MIAKVIRDAIKKQLTLEADNEFDTRHRNGCEAWVSHIQIVESKNEIHYKVHFHDIEAGYNEEHEATAKLDETIEWSVKNGFLKDEQSFMDYDNGKLMVEATNGDKP